MACEAKMLPGLGERKWDIERRERGRSEIFGVREVTSAMTPPILKTPP
jgi:hypothetical protein